MQNRALSFFRWNVDFVVHFLLNTFYHFLGQCETGTEIVQEVRFTLYFENDKKDISELFYRVFLGPP